MIIEPPAIDFLTHSTRKTSPTGLKTMIKRLLPAALTFFAAIMIAGCTTSGTSTAQFSPAVTEMPDLAFAPIPAIKPDSSTLGFAAASLASSEAEPLATTVAYAGPTVDDKPFGPQPVIASAIPDEAVQVASAEPINTNPVKAGARDRECLMRAMYFESNRSSRDGQLAVGTVVMHRLATGKWGNSVCGVVGAPRQFAPGVMTRKLQGDITDLAELAQSILSGKRHPAMNDKVMFFHQAGLKFPYKNMHYVVVAGGNTFYYKTGRRRG